MLRKHGVDVCFVDGLHTYEQSLRDVLNALRYLRPDGVIVVHDCNPPSAIIACPAANIDELIRKGPSGWTGAWSGDVWKAIVHVRSLHPELDAFVLDCDTGVGVITRRQARTPLSYGLDEIRALNYTALEVDRSRLLDLRPPEYFATFLKQHSRRSGSLQ